MKSLEEILQQHPIFSKMEVAYRNYLVEHSQKITFGNGELILKELESADKFYFISSGRVSIELYYNSKRIILQTLSEGDIVGWSWLIPPYHWQFDAWAVEDVTLVAIDANEIRALCEQEPEFGYIFVSCFNTIIAKRLQAARVQLLDMYGSVKTPDLRGGHNG